MNNRDQIDYWNGQAGEKWVVNSDLLDAMLDVFADKVLSVGQAQPGETVLDIGCGAGALSLKAAAQVGKDGQVIGVDVSEPMVALARQRADHAGLPARFTVEDASTFKSDTPANLLVSRFGVMFFADPAEAFSALRKNMAPGGRLSFACWRAMPENDWVRIPLELTLPFLKAPPEMPPANAPGPFAFSDKAHVSDLLTRAGWQNVAIEPWDCQMQIPGADIAQNTRFMMELGPASRLIAAQELDPAPIADALKQKLASLADPEGQVRMKAAVWIVTARA